MELISSGGQLSDPTLKTLQSNLGDSQIYVLSTYGTQGSGKSTLLNEVFGANFSISEAGKSRAQVKKGVNAAAITAAESGAGYLLLDVDSSDAKDKSKELERKLTRFTLEVSDFVVVTLWYHEVGRQQTASAAALKVLFEEASRKAKDSSDSKSQLLLVVRDVDEQHNPDELTAAVTFDAEWIWSEVAKPPQRLSDVFRVSVIALPHHRYSASAYKAAIEALHLKLTSPAEESFAFETGFQPKVTGDLAEQVSKAWAEASASASPEPAPAPPSEEAAAPTIPGVSAIDLESTYHSDQVYFETYSAFLSQIKPWKNAMFVEAFGKRANDLINTHLEKFDLDMGAYKSSAVAQRKRGELRNAMLSELHAIFAKLVPRVKGTALQKFKNALMRPLDNIDAFLDLVERESKAQELFFLNRCNQCVVPGAPWAVQTERLELQASMQEYAEDRKSVIVQNQRMHELQEAASRTQPKMTNFNFSFGFNFGF